MQSLCLHAGTDIQRRSGREDGIRSQVSCCVIVGPMVRRCDRAQEVVEDFLQRRLLEPGFPRRGAAPEEEGAACCFRGQRL